jgi:hypothetical protein
MLSIAQKANGTRIIKATENLKTNDDRINEIASDPKKNMAAPKT